MFGPLDRYRRRHGLERIADDATPDPISVYGACKAQVERLAAHYAATWGLDITGLRPCGTQGRRRLRSDLSLIVDPLQRVARGEPAIVREADWVFPLIHIDDVVDAVLAALRRPDRGDGRSYNLAAHHTTLREVAGVLGELVPGARIEIEGCATEPSARIEASGIERDLGIRSRRGLKEGVADMLEEARGAPG